MNRRDADSSIDHHTAASTCPFCDYTGPSDVLHYGKVLTRFDEIDFFVIEPLNPVTPGHRLVVPVEHVADFREYPEMLGALMQVAANVADEVAPRPDGSANLIVSAGAAATQTVPHVHVHVVPRRERDGLTLPWSDRG